MFAVGHIALGYLTGKLLSRVSDIELNIPAILTLSLLPDVDLLIPGLQHRGPTHSLLFILLISIPLLTFKLKESPIYIAALSTHSLIGDSITDGGIQLLWPFSEEWIKYSYTIMMTSRFEVYMEISLFAMLFLTMILSGDLQEFLRPNGSNRLLFIPLSTIVLPAMFSYPMGIPIALIPPHLALLGVVGVSFMLSLFKSTHIIGGKGNHAEGSGSDKDG